MTGKDVVEASGKGQGVTSVTESLRPVSTMEGTMSAPSRPVVEFLFCHVVRLPDSNPDHGLP